MTSVCVNDEECIISIDFSPKDRQVVERAANDLGYDIENYIRSVLYSAIEATLREQRFQYYLRTGKADTSPALNAVLAHLEKYPVSIHAELHL